MQRNYAVHSATNSIDVVLERGAAKLYDKYLNQKLPGHTHGQNSTMVEANLNLQQVNKPNRDKIESVPLVKVEHIPIDNHAPKKIPVHKQQDRFSTLSPKNTTFGKSTKYQTIVQSQPSKTDKNKNTNIQNESYLSQQPFAESIVVRKSDRPFTMGTGRVKPEQLQLQSKLQQVQEKRAATCHTRRRKDFNKKNQKDRLVKIKDEVSFNNPEEIQALNRLRKWKLEQQEEQLQKQNQQAKVNAHVRMREKRIKNDFEDLKLKVKGKNKQAPPLTNFESINGEITINQKPRPPKTHIIQLQFNPEEEKTYRSLDPKVSGVNAKKKNAFTTKLKKKVKISNEEYTNNGSRQISSIPFMALNYGIALSESTIEATATRRRPAEEISREQFTTQALSNRFKSHIPIVNSARINLFATIDDNGGAFTARSSFMEGQQSTEKRQFETTYDSKKQQTKSLLWRQRGKSQSKKIRISNQAAFECQLLDMKMAH